MHKTKPHPRFPENLTKARTACDMSRPELERRVKIPENSIYMYETGRREPSIRVLAALAKALDRTPNDLLDGWP